MGEKWWPNGAWDMHPGFFYRYITSIYTSDICSWMMVALKPKHVAAIYDRHSKAVH